jgi:hypothetical protein
VPTTILEVFGGSCGDEVRGMSAHHRYFAVYAEGGVSAPWNVQVGQPFCFYLPDHAGIILAADVSWHEESAAKNEKVSVFPKYIHVQYVYSISSQVFCVLAYPKWVSVCSFVSSLMAAKLRKNAETAKEM